MTATTGGASAAGAPAKSREVRLGLVMYGGVSLAIYINGIAHELFRAVRGRGTYRLLKALTDSDVVVDVMSGSSAGGINGVLLGYALCNEKEFAPAAKLWRQRGDIGQLLRDTDEPASTYQSLFDSENKYEPWLREAFDQLGGSDVAAATRKKEDPSPVNELDLFITGTDFYGRKWVSRDDQGAAVDVKSHRAVFRLKHRTRLPRSRPAGLDRQLARLPFSPEAGPGDRLDRGKSHTHEALARLCRITSCFPAAFAPVTVGVNAPADLRLREWGGLPDMGERIYIDGGVLDNKPFSMTLDAIYSRLSMRPVKRCLIYVEPDPERFEADPNDLRTPNMLRTGIASLISLPGYESIADDLRSLFAHNDRVRRTRALTTMVRRALDKPPTPSGVPDAASMEAYQKLRLQGLSEQLFAAVFTRELNRPIDDQRVRTAQQSLREWFDDNILGARDGFARFESFDIEFRLRRLFYLVYAELTPEPEADAHAPREALSPEMLDAINRQIELLEIIRSRMEAAVASVAEEWFAKDNGTKFDTAWANAAWGDIRTALTAVLRIAPPVSCTRLSGAGDADAAVAKQEMSQLLTPDELGQVYDAMTQMAKERDRGKKDAPSAGQLLESCDAFERRLLSASPEHLRRYEDFPQVDRVVYPVECIAGLRSHDVIHFTRISPADARIGLADREMTAKVTGHRVNHFAAFFKRSWRSNDILWGRIDGACKLVSVLLDTGRVAELFGANAPNDSAAKNALRKLVLELKADGAAIPLPKDTRRKLFDWLERLLDSRTCSDAIAELERSDKEENAGVETDDDGGGPRRWLIEAAQFEAVFDDIHAIYEDAAGEQLEWNQYQSSAGKPFMPGEGRPDPALVLASVAHYGKAALEEATKSPEALAAFLNERFHVARETTRDIPPLVVLDWIARGLIVAQKGLLESLGERREAVRSNPVYQVVLGWPLRVFAGVVSVLRRSPTSIAAGTLAAFAYIILSIAVVLSWPEVVWNEGKLDEFGAILFLVVPVFSALLVRFTVASRDGSGLLVWALRIVGWPLALILLLIATPIVWHLFALEPAVFCQGDPIPRLPVWLGSWYSAVCMKQAESISIIGGWVVLLILGFGVIGVTGSFGWLTRSARASTRRMKRALWPKLQPPIP